MPSRKNNTSLYPSTFLYTDIEGFTEKWETRHDDMTRALVRHDAILSEEISRHSGRIIKRTDDGICAIFDGGDPLECALKVQLRMSMEDWGELGEIRVRMAIHTGLTEIRGKEHFGPTIIRTARVLGVGHGGQILLTSEAASSCKLPSGASLQDLGNHLLKDMGGFQRLFGLMHPEMKQQIFPPLRSLSAHPNNLPSALTPFIGREQELRHIKETLRSSGCRALTLAGPEGAGKTRLAIQVAADRIDQFKDGVWLVPLAQVSSPDFIPSAIAVSLRFQFHAGSDQKTQILNYLREKNMLIILDGFESRHEGTGFINEILGTAADVSILATVGNHPGFRSEQVFDVPGLSVPKNTDETAYSHGAYQLFLESACRIFPDFESDERMRRHIVQICRLVNGMPLGIVLASAWVGTHSCEEIALGIQKSADTLHAKRMDINEHQKSIHSVFEYSWNLLSAEERALFSRLSVFRGGFFQDAAEKIAFATLPLLSQLIEKLLIVHEPAGRYQIHPLLRHFAEEKLAENTEEKDDVFARHASYFLQYVHTRERDLISKRQKDAAREIDGEIGNVMSAWTTALSSRRFGEIDIMLSGLHDYFSFRGLSHEAQHAFSMAYKAMENIAGDKESMVPLFRAKIASRLTWFSQHLGRDVKILDLLDQSLKILRAHSAKLETAWALRQLIWWYPKDQARERLKESLEISRDIHDVRGIGDTMAAMGEITAWGDGDYQAASDLFEASLKASQETGNPQSIGWALHRLGSVKNALGGYASAKGLIERAVEIARESDARYALGMYLTELTNAASGLGEHEDAIRHAKEAVSILREAGEYYGVIKALTILGRVLHVNRLDSEAKDRLVEAMTQSTGPGKPPVQSAFSTVILAEVTLDLGELQESLRLIHVAIQTARKEGILPLIVESVGTLACLLAKTGDPEHAAELAYFVAAHPLSEYRMKAPVWNLLKTLKSKLAADALTKAEECAKARKLDELADAILCDEI
jgi:predicted ATPase/class 3 adenylate cyclase